MAIGIAIFMPADITFIFGLKASYRIAGFFRGGIFSRIHTATIFRGKIFTNDTVFLITAVEISTFSQVKFSRIELDSRNS